MFDSIRVRLSSLGSGKSGKGVWLGKLGVLCVKPGWGWEATAVRWQLKLVRFWDSRFPHPEARPPPEVV